MYFYQQSTFDKSTVGIMQGDCLSAVLFIYYLAKCLKEEQTKMYGFYLCPKYADDITYETTSLEKLEEIEKFSGVTGCMLAIQSSYDHNTF